MRRTTRARALAPLGAALLTASLLGGCGDDEPEVGTDAPTAAQEDVEDAGEEPTEEPLGEDDANEGEPGEASGACQEALVAAASAQDIGPTETEGAVGPAGDEDAADDAGDDAAGGDDDADDTQTGEAVPGGEFDVEAVLPAFEACESVEEFASALEDSPQALLGSDTNEPDEFVRLTCEEQSAVQDTPLCQSVG